jgi:hypothetical protein
MTPNPSRSGQPRGFALVISLSLMVLLVVLSVGLLGLSAISLRSSTQSEAMQVAKANARMALVLALGELQKASGPDQSITATSAIRTGAKETQWTGAWSTAPGASEEDVRWLVSGETPDPVAGPGADPMVLVDGKNAAMKVNAPAVTVKPVGKDIPGRYAWWIGDEGVKARVDLQAPLDPPTPERKRIALSQSPAEAGLKSLGKSWAKLAADDELDRAVLVSMSTASLATEDLEVPEENFADLTTGGFGLPVNVVDGAMKADLSLIFDKSQKSKKYASRYMGATAGSMNHNGANIFQFGVSDPKKFFLSKSLSKNGSVQVGPNWGNLWNYATLWQNAVGQQYPIVSANPTPWADLRFRDWLPYTNHNAGTYQNDFQHTNSPLQPIVSTLQMGFRLKAKPAPLPPGSPPNSKPVFRAQVELKPVFGLWNPYNATIRANPYTLQWALYPYFRLNYSTPSGADSRITYLWLRDAWTTGGGTIPTPEKQTDGKYFSVETDAIDLQPGEFRLFSVTDQIQIQAGKSYKLKSGWSEKGAFVVDLSYEAKDGTLAERLVPSGYQAWFGDILLQDTQSKDTLARYPDLDTTKTASTWFTLKSGGNVLLRSTELWNGDPGPKEKVPEPVVSGWKGGAANNTTKQKFIIDDLAGDSVVAHIATWSFYGRTSTQMTEPAQRLRGWIDSNPRAFVTNPAWDGSIVNGTARSGWHLTSHLMGGTHDPAPSGQVGDGFGGNRGLIGEGGLAEPEPQVDPSNIGRYRGYGGPSNTTTGQTHVIIYDAPRTPLVSVGQFQHAQLSRYNFEPGFVVGNSYANPRIPLNTTINNNFSGKNGLTIVDTSHEVNSRLWDGFFFSTLGIDYIATSGSSFDKIFDFKKLSTGETVLPNPRMTFQPASSDTGIDAVIAAAGDRAPEAIASRIGVKGAFNINSTSVTAWKAMLSTMGSAELPIMDPGKGTVSWQRPEGVRFNRFGHVLSNSPYEEGGSGADRGFWQGWRELSDSELEKLATEIVTEVKERGPFRSLAEFVNRDPVASDNDHKLKGALQAALDRTVNAKLPADVGVPARKPVGSAFSNAITGESNAAGSASYLLQGDVLQSLAPVIQPRSDYFRIRTCGEALDGNGKVIARAWCEAFVQRGSAYVDPTEQAWLASTELKSEANRKFGRRYEVVSFRWLHDAGA